MTWVIGRAGPLGYAVGLSDIAASFADGTEIDCVQKIHRISSSMAIGFAGSIRIGFEFVEQFRYALHPEGKKIVWDPLEIANSLSDGAKKLFNSFPENIRDGGCNLMLLSAHPIENDGAAPWPRCYVHRFYAPDFQPVVNRPSEIVSIGSGDGIAEYASILRAQEKDFDVFKLEVGMKGGAALGLMTSISSAIRNNPKKGISTHLHVCIIGRGEMKIGNNDRTRHKRPEDNFIMPPVAQNWEELVETLQSKGAAISAIESAQC